MDNVLVREYLDNKKNVFKKLGKENLLVVTDFDRTLTHAYKEDGEPVPSLISVLRDEKHIDGDYAQRAKELFDTYFPIENDSSIPYEKRYEAMEEWWRKHTNLLIEKGLTRDIIRKAAQSSRIRLRTGVVELFKWFESENIPVVIFSSNNLGRDSVKDCLEYHKILYSNVSVISNKFEYDNNGVVIGHRGNLLHTYNKNFSVVENNKRIRDKVLSRDLALVIGDSLGDRNMVDDSHFEEVISFGFLNENSDEKAKEYSDIFDVVIKNDGEFTYIEEILREVFG